MGPPFGGPRIARGSRRAPGPPRAADRHEFAPSCAARSTTRPTSKMNWPRALALFAVAFAFAGLLAAAGPWVPPAGPALVQVVALTPTDVEPGDRIAIAGEGFPAGKEARVTLPGDSPSTGREAGARRRGVVTGTVAGPEQVEVAFARPRRRSSAARGTAPCTPPSRATSRSRSPRLRRARLRWRATLRHAVLDVRPSASPADRGTRPTGERALAFMGLRVTAASRRGAGPDGRERRGRDRAPTWPAWRAGDVITTLRRRARRRAWATWCPAPGEREATLGVRGRRRRVRRRRARSPWTACAARLRPSSSMRRLLVAAALGILLLLGSPAPSSLATALQRAASRLRARAGSAASSARSLPGLARVGPARAIAVAAVRETLPPLAASALVDAVVAAAPGRHAVRAVPAWPRGSTWGCSSSRRRPSLAVAAVVAAGVGAGRGLRAAAHVAWQHVPAALAVASVVLTTGSLRVQENRRAPRAAGRGTGSPSAARPRSWLWCCSSRAARIAPERERAGAAPIEALVDDGSRVRAAGLAAAGSTRRAGRTASSSRGSRARCSSAAGRCPASRPPSKTGAVAPRGGGCRVAARQDVDARPRAGDPPRRAAGPASRRRPAVRRPAGGCPWRSRRSGRRRPGRAGAPKGPRSSSSAARSWRSARSSPSRSLSGSGTVCSPPGETATSARFSERRVQGARELERSEEWTGRRGVGARAARRPARCPDSLRMRR